MTENSSLPDILNLVKEMCTNPEGALTEFWLDMSAINTSYYLGRIQAVQACGAFKLWHKLKSLGYVGEERRHLMVKYTVFAYDIFSTVPNSNNNSNVVPFKREKKC